jgi:hypothetical protein
VRHAAALHVPDIRVPGGATRHTLDTARFLRAIARGVDDWQPSKSQAEQAREALHPVARAWLWAGPPMLTRALVPQCKLYDRSQACYRKC